MSGPGEESCITNFALIAWITPEAILLHITNRLQEESQTPQNNAGDIAPGPESGLLETQHIGRIDDRYRQTHAPDPYHLEDPEPEEGEEFIAHLVEAVVLAGLDDSE